MLYLGEDHVEALGLLWDEWLPQIETAIAAMDAGDYAQPLKPYLRYRHPRNRIIAMPAYVGGRIEAAGLKWIASFPGNLEAGLPRAHSVTILNDTDTGRPVAIINTSLISAIRTAAVSGIMLRRWLERRSLDRRQPLRVGIIGFGPIGRLHASMCRSLLGERLSELYVYDIRGVQTPGYEKNGPAAIIHAGPPRPGGKHDEAASPPPAFVAADSWEELYDACDAIITCTVSERRYIDRPPRRGMLLLDVSLRDYTVEALQHVQAVIVDDWAEVCRENTDIELLHRERGLTSGATRTLADVVLRNALLQFPPDEPVLFCPMGMAAFDIAVAEWCVRRAEALGIGIRLA